MACEFPYIAVRQVRLRTAISVYFIQYVVELLTSCTDVCAADSKSRVISSRRAAQAALVSTQRSRVRVRSSHGNHGQSQSRSIMSHHCSALIVLITYFAYCSSVFHSRPRSLTLSLIPGKLFPASSGSWSDFITWTTLKIHD